VKVREVIGMLEADGWFLVRTPTEKQAAFNQNIVGLIEVVSEFHSK